MNSGPNLLTLPILIRFWLNLGLNDLKFGQEFISEISDLVNLGDSVDLGDSGDLRNEFQDKFINFANSDYLWYLLINNTGLAVA